MDVGWFQKSLSVCLCVTQRKRGRRKYSLFKQVACCCLTHRRVAPVPNLMTGVFQLGTCSEQKCSQVDSYLHWNWTVFKLCTITDINLWRVFKLDIYVCVYIHIDIHTHQRTSELEDCPWRRCWPIPEISLHLSATLKRKVQGSCAHRGGPSLLPTASGGSWKSIWAQGKKSKKQSAARRTNVGGQCIPKHDWLAAVQLAMCCWKKDSDSL